MVLDYLRGKDMEFYITPQMIVIRNENIYAKIQEINCFLQIRMLQVVFFIFPSSTLWENFWGHVEIL